MEHFGVEPDLMTIAKSIAAGFRSRESSGGQPIMDAPGDSAVRRHLRRQPGRHRRCHAVLDTIAEDRLVDRAVEVGETIRARMESWRDRFDSVARCAGSGRCWPSSCGKTASRPADLATAVAEAAARNGLLILKAGIHGNCIRVLVPLVIGDSELDEALGAWEEALEEASA
jgi:4-aminobutyrate aminotransferase-like enzyme